MGLEDVWFFLAGTALFIFAMTIVEEALKSLAGRSFKKFLHKHTENKIKAILGGTAVTALLQSSSVVLLMTLSFVGAGIISMRNALAITLGSNLGTTLDSWVVAALGFKTNFTSISYILLAITIIGIFFSKNKRIKNIFRFITGFALLFVGLDMMKDSASVVIDNFDLRQYGHLSPYLFIPIGILITFLIQSSSATVAITLTALYNGAIPFESAAAVVIGSELGTTIKLLIGSIGGNSDKKRVALGNFFYNLVLVILATSFLHLLVILIKQKIHIQDDLLALVFFQTFMNVSGVIIFYPLLGFVAKLLGKIYVNKKPEVNLKYIKPSIQPFPDDSLIMAKKEIFRLLRHTMEFNLITIQAQKDDDVEQKKIINYLKDMFQPYEPELAYNHLKMLQGRIIQYLAELPKEEMNNEEIQQTGVLITVSRNVIHSAKNIKDIGHNLIDLEGSSIELLRNLYIELVNQEKVLYVELQRFLELDLKSGIVDTLENLQNKNKVQHQANIEEVLQLIKTDKISELEASSLLNVYREIYSSNKSLVEVLMDLWDK